MLAESNRRDAEALGARRIEVVPNGIPDPCPDFESTVLPRRIARAKHHAALASGTAANSPASSEAGVDAGTFRVCFIGLCSRSKGLFDAVEAVALLHQRLRERASALRVRLTVAGSFANAETRAEFDARVARADVQDESGQIVEWIGFVDAAARDRLLRESDCLCFPTYYEAESFGLVVVEAMACGLPVVATRWRAIPELLPRGVAFLVEPKSPAGLADAFESVLREPPDVQSLRRAYLARFTVEFHVATAAAALKSYDGIAARSGGAR